MRKGKAVLRLAIAVTLLSVGILGAYGQKQQLVISCWGGSSEKNLSAVSKAFEDANNVELVYDVGNNSDRLNKLRAQKNDPEIDVAFLTSSFSAIGNQEGLFEKVSVKDVPNINDLYDFAKSKTGYGPTYSVTSYGLFYDTQKVSPPPTSWNDLWDPKYAGKISVADITGTSGPLLLVEASAMASGDRYNIDAGFKKMAQLKPSIFNFYLSSSDVATMFERGEIVMVPFADMFLKALQDSGLHVAMVVPKEGSFATPATINIVKGTKNLALAEKYVNFILGADTQARIAAVMSESPVNRKTVLSPEVAKYLIYGEAAVKKLLTFDDDFINNNKAAWIERWDKEISNK
jgi:putative spermidine/putrescine transport system substrate-binding protein